MGIKNLPWKKIWKYLWKIVLGTIFLISAIIGIATNWGAVSNWLSSVWDFFLKIFNPLANPIVRDILLLIFIVAILIWLILINRKLKKLPLIDKGEAKVVDEKEKKEEVKKVEKQEKEKELAPTYKQRYVLWIFANAPGNIRLGIVFERYKKKFPDVLMVEFKSIISDLEEGGFIKHTGNIGSDRVYRATNKCNKYIEKRVKKARAVEN